MTLEGVDDNEWIVKPFMTRRVVTHTHYSHVDVRLLSMSRFLRNKNGH